MWVEQTPLKTYDLAIPLILSSFFSNVAKCVKVLFVRTIIMSLNLQWQHCCDYEKMQYTVISLSGCSLLVEIHYASSTGNSIASLNTKVFYAQLEKFFYD